MDRRTLAYAALVVLFIALAASGQEPTTVVIGGESGIAGLTIVPVGGVQASDGAAVPGGEGGAWLWQFRNTDTAPRLLALSAPLDGGLPEGLLSAQLRCSATLAEGNAPRLAVALFEKSGACWFALGPTAPTAQVADARISLASLRQAAFSTDESGTLEWGEVARVWVGAVLQGHSAGTFRLSRAVLTSEPYKAEKPLRLTGNGPGTWTVGKDPAVTAVLTMPDEGPDGKQCMKVEFHFPGQQHMYMVPSTSVPTGDMEGYSALRFTYKAELPPGIPGLLVMFGEQGAQFYASPPPPPSEDWTTITIPLDQFKLGEWTKDDNGQLDMARVSAVMVGCHGAATGAGGPGSISVCDIELVP